MAKKKNKQLAGRSGDQTKTRKIELPAGSWQQLHADNELFRQLVQDHLHVMSWIKAEVEITELTVSSGHSNDHLIDRLNGPVKMTGQCLGYWEEDTLPPDSVVRSRFEITTCFSYGQLDGDYCFTLFDDECQEGNQSIEMWYNSAIPVFRLELWNDEATLELNQSLHFRHKTGLTREEFIEQYPEFAPSFPDKQAKVKLACCLFQSVSFFPRRAVTHYQVGVSANLIADNCTIDSHFN